MSFTANLPTWRNEQVGPIFFVVRSSNGTGHWTLPVRRVAFLILDGKNTHEQLLLLLGTRPHPVTKELKSDGVMALGHR